jgi:UDP-3-O-[3-hydroxymyristoyl] glucosamine N-acyltransferase
MKRTVRDIAALVGGEISGDSTRVITGVTSLARAGPSDIAFIESERQAAGALESPAGCLIVPEGVTVGSKTLIGVGLPKLAFAKVVEIFHPSIRPAAGIHPSAIIGPDVELADGVSIGPYAVIEAGVRIRPRTVLGAGVYVGAGCSIGEDCVFNPNVTLYPNVSVGARVIVHAGTVLGGDGFGYVNVDGVYHKFPQVGRLVIEDDVEIGSNVSIDRGTLEATIIRRGTKIDNLTQIAHNVCIGEHCVLAAQVGAAGSSRIGKGAVIGGQVGIADHVTIGEGAIVGAQAGIPSGKRIHPGEFVWGTPARPMSEFKAQYGSLTRLPRLIAELEELKRRIAQLEEQLREQP